jgi:hypothetical protein
VTTNVIETFKLKRDSLATKTKWGLGLLAAVLFAPVTWLLAQAVFGLAALGGALALAGVVGVAIIHGAPVLSMRFANWKLSALKAEAERNPIETLQNQQVELEHGLSQERKAITAFDTEVENYRSSLQGEVEKGFPEAAQSGLPTLKNMERLLTFRRIKYKKAQTRLEERKKSVHLAESKYRVALAAQRVTAASGELGNSVLQQILEDIAFGAVDSAVNTSMAELRTAIMVEELPTDDADWNVVDITPPALTNNPSNTIDVNALRQALSVFVSPEDTPR